MAPNAIAIVGMSFKMPQGVETEDGLWEVLQQRKSTMTRWPESRLNIEAFHDTDPDRTDKVPALGAHFLSEDPRAFDAAFFSMTAKEASVTDPEQRLALEASYRAFENAGLPIENLRGSPTAVVGVSSTDDYTRIIAKDPDRAPRNAFLGTSSCLAPNRISWFFDLVGPSAHVQTACSSSVVALDMACQYINSGDASMALVVGSSLMLGAEQSIQLSNLNIVSPDSVSYVFDHRANGFSRGEGVVALVLKPVADAVRDGDAIRAVIRATGTNQNGKSNHIAHPSAELQEALIRHVYRKAELPLNETCYVEAHGTGTTVGDLAEMTSIAKVFGPARSPGEPLFVGSLKANFGHLEGCSGLASVVKAILILKNGIIPPQALFEKIHPDVDAVRHNTEVPTKSVALPEKGPRRVSVDSFGVGGTNGHIILDHVSAYLEPHALANALAGHFLSSNGHTSSDPMLLVWSASQEKSLDQMVESYTTWSRGESFRSGDELRKLAYTLGRRRSMMLWRTFSVVSEGLPITDFQAAKSVRSQGRPVAALVFTGQGAQYASMGMELLRYLVFKETLKQTAAAFQRLGCDWSLFDKIHDPEAIHVPEYSQPLTTALQISLYELLKSFGFEPAAVVGHSSGEIAAAYAIGALSLESACKVAYYRGTVAAEVKASMSSKPGAMMSVNLSPSGISDVLRRIDLSSSPSTPIHIACVNSPYNCTLSGDEKVIDDVKAQLDVEGIFAKKLNTGVAYHSPAMEAVASRYTDLIGSLQSAQQQTASIVMVSTVTGRSVEASEVVLPEYWVRNLVQPVQFSEAISSLVMQTIPNATDIIEIGPHHALGRPLRDVLNQLPPRKTETRSLFVLDRAQPPMRCILKLVGQLFCHGYHVSISSANVAVPQSRGDLLLVDCPGYPFNHANEYWFESRISRDFRLRKKTSGALLGHRASDWNPLEPSWRQVIDLEVLPWLKDYSDSNMIRFPAAALLVMALEAVHEISVTNETVAGYQVKKAYFLGNVDFDISEDDSELVTRLYTEKEAGWVGVKIFAYTASVWTERFWCHLQILYEGQASEIIRPDSSHLLEDYEVACSAKSRRIASIANGRSSGHHKLYIYDDVSQDSTDAKLISKRTTSTSEHQTSSIAHVEILNTMFQMFQTLDSKNRSPFPSSFRPSTLSDGWFSALSSLPYTTTLHHLAKLQEQGQRGILKGEVAVLKEQYIPLLTIQELRLESDEQESGSHYCFETRSLHGIEWRPHLSLLSPAQLHQICHAAWYFADEKSVVSQFNMLNWIMDQALRITFSGLSPQDIHRASSSFGQYVKWAQHHMSTSSPVEFMQNFEELKHNDDEISAITDLEPYFRAIDEQCPQWAMFTAIARNLRPILLGEVSPLALAFGEEGNAAKFYPWYFKPVSDERLERLLHLIVHEKRELRIIEFGAGTGGWTRMILSFFEQLELRTGIRAFSEFVFTDVSASFFEHARAEFSDFANRMTFKVLDLDCEVLDQGFEAGVFDLALAACVIHAASDITMAVSNIRRLLRPGGHVVAIEITTPGKLFNNFAFGTLPGWGGAIEDWRALSPVFDEATWDKLWKENGFSGNDVSIRDYENDTCQTLSVLCSTAIERNQDIEDINCLLIIYNQSRNQADLAHTLTDEVLTPAGHTCTILSLEQVGFNNLIDADIVISLIEWDKSVLAQLSSTEFNQIKEVVRSSQKLIWVSAGTLTDSQYASQNLAQGFFRSIQLESIEKETITLLFESQAMKLTTAADQISKVIQKSLCEAEEDDQYIFRDGVLTTARLVEEADLTMDVRSIAFSQTRLEPLMAGCAVKLTPDTPNSPRFVQEEADDEPLKTTEVKIKAMAWGLSRRQALSGFGTLTEEQSHGLGCAGVIAMTGPATDFQVGDRVYTIVPGTIRSAPKEDAELVYRLPASLALDVAASVAYPGIAALYCLEKLARLQKGETILISSGVCGVGRMAIQIAKVTGARVFIITRHEDERHTLMKEFEIPDTHIFHHVTGVALDRKLKRITQGRGVDVFLNTAVSSRGKQNSLSFMSSHGRFIELSTENAATNAATAFASMRAAISYTVVNMYQTIISDSTLLSTLLDTVVSLLEKGILQPPNHIQSYDVSETGDALSHLQDDAAPNMADIVLTATPSSLVQKFTPATPNWGFDPQSSYLIAGGLGGIGRAIIRWMLSRGARYFIVPSRSGAVSEQAMALVAEVQKLGATIETPSCDVASSVRLGSMLNEYEKIMPPVRGCINASMVLQDALFDKMTYEQWSLAIESKASTSWNLHKLLPSNLDFFILLSSVFGTLGSIAQSNYSAGCSYQDALARHRLSQSPPQKAVSIDVGWMRSVGIVAETEAFARTRQNASDLWEIEAFELVALLDVLCDPSRPPTACIDKAQVLIGVKTPADYFATSHSKTSSSLSMTIPHVLTKPVFSGFPLAMLSSSVVEANQEVETEDAAQLFKDASSVQDKADVAVKAIMKKVATALAMVRDDVDPSKPLSHYGVDSLMSVELRNWIGRDFSAKLEEIEMMGGGRSISDIGHLVVEKSK